MNAKKKVSKKKTRRSSKKEKLPLLPLRDIVIFPRMVLPFFVGRKMSVAALEAANKEKINLFLVCQKDQNIENPEQEDVFEVGIEAKILQLVKLPDGTLKVLVEGLQRAKLKKWTQEEDCVWIDSETMSIDEASNNEVEALTRSLKKSFENYVKLNKRIPPDVLIPIQNIEEAGDLCDSICTHLNLKLNDKQELLEEDNIKLRIEKLYGLLENEVEILRVERRIRGRVKKQLEKSQKEYYLNEQMAAIQKELGDRDEFKAEISNVEKDIKESGMTEEAQKKCESDLKKLKMMAPMSPEATVLRNYLDWVINLPWKTMSNDNLDLDHAKNILNKDHCGLHKIKERILEFIAVQNFSKKSNGPIICFVGPPGVGKTSFAASIAKALERKYVRVSLGGLRDEAEIRGHRRTYIGAQPGKIIQSVKKASTRNPVIVLDEIDKMGADFRGDPASAMLEVLDPEQNHSFNDHYIEVDYDLSDVMFIATANTISTIPSPLLDRMELIELSSYTEEEKLKIALEHLVPKQLKRHGLDESKIQICDDSIMELIRYYTRESGVRNLEREIAKLIRKAAKKFLIAEKKKPVIVAQKDLHDYLGPREYNFGSIEKTDQIGMTNGLCWTPVGGDTLNIEVSILPGRGKLTITGKLGDVMQESAQAAYSYVRSRAERWGLEKDFYKNIDIHIHVPEGATPKDGPSAGTAMANSLTSALLSRPVRKDVAMTGEITLRGNVLPIGGVKEKS